MALSKDEQIDFIQSELDKEFEVLHHAEMCIKSIKASIDFKTRLLDEMMSDASACAAAAGASAFAARSAKIMFHFGADLPPPRSGYKRYKLEFKVKVDATLSTPKLESFGVSDAVEIFAAKGKIRNEIRVLLSNDWKRQIDDEAVHFLNEYPCVWQVPLLQGKYTHWIWLWVYLAN